MKQNRQEYEQPERLSDLESTCDCNAVDECVKQQSDQRGDTDRSRDLVHLLTKMEMGRERVLREVDENIAREDDEPCGRAVLGDRFRNKVEKRDRDHEACGKSDELVERRHAPPRTGRHRRRADYVCAGRDQRVRDRGAYHACVNASRSAAALIAADSDGASARSHDWDRQVRSANDARSSSPFPCSR